MEVNVKCPNCKNTLVKIDSKDDILRQKKCSKCGNIIKFRLKSNYFKIEKAELRNSSSGTRIY